MFQFPGLASAGLCIRREDTQMRGFPHSESPWSKTLCVSHGTFGAWPVLRRRLMPRHPPRAFLRLNPVFQRFSSIYCCMSSSNPPLILGASSHSVLVAFSYVVAKVFNLLSISRTDFPCAGALSSGAKETRTPNIQLAKLALYQLSYNPERYGPEWT